jgi:GT2 family glycosyltransferase
MRYDVSIIIVNYNGIKYLNNLLISLNKINNSSINYEIIIVDNNSNDGSIEFLERIKNELNMDIKIINSKINLGFAGGNNLGVDNASGEYIVFLNNDTIVDKDWLVNLYDKINSSKEFGIVASKILFFHKFLKLEIITNNEIEICKKIFLDDIEYSVKPKFSFNVVRNEKSIKCNKRSFLYIPINLEELSDILCVRIRVESVNNLKSSFKILNKIVDVEKGKNEVEIRLEKSLVENNVFDVIQNAGSNISENFSGYDIGFGERDNGQYDNEREINNACGASMIIRREDFVSCGKFDDKFFMYYEDTDLSYRLKNKTGKKIIYCPKSIVRHIHTGTSEEWSPFFVYHVYRNRLFFVRRNFGERIYKSCLIKDFNNIVRCLEKNKEDVILREKMKAIFDSTF